MVFPDKSLVTLSSMENAPSLKSDEEKENVIRRSEPITAVFLQNHFKVL